MPSPVRTMARRCLEALERGNFFVVPLDDKRHWYRYHHLFADVLRAHLLAEQPEQVAIRCIGARASGTSSMGRGRCDPPRAGRRGFRAGGGPGRAGSASHAPEPTGGHVAWLAQGAPRRVGPLPARAQRCVCRVLLLSGELEGVEARLRDAERWLETTRSAAYPQRPRRPRWSSWTTRHFAVCPATIAVYRAGLALALGDVPAP